MIYCKTHGAYLWREAITRHLEDERNTGCELVEVPETDGELIPRTALDGTGP